MLKKIIILLLCNHYAMNLLAQITTGELSFIRIDSMTYEYGFNSNSDGSDTVTQFLNGKMVIKVINKLNYKDYFEQSRDSSTILFNNDYSIALWDYSQFGIEIAKVADFKSKILTNYSRKGGQYNKVRDFKMYEDLYFGQNYEIFDFKIDRNDRKLINNIEGYKIEYKEKRVPGFTYIVQMYVCEDIKYPIKMLVNFPKDVKMCPIYIEQYNEQTPKIKTITKLIGVKKVSETTIENKLKEIK